MEYRDRVVSEWEGQEMLRSYRTLGIDFNSRYFIVGGNDRSEEALSLSNDDLRLLVGVHTKHCGLLAHQRRISRSEEDICRFSGDQMETSLHILCECEAVQKRRAFLDCLFYRLNKWNSRGS